MHSLAIFFGVMLFAWCLHGLKMFVFYVGLVTQEADPG